MSTFSPSVVRQCPNCSSEVPLGALDCPQCHALIHAAELNVLAKEAQELEAKNRPAEAREAWNRALSLLPANSKQADWISARINALNTSATSATPAAPSSVWVRRLGPLAPIAIVLAKSKGLLLAIFKLKFLLSFFSFIAVYVALFGWKFGVGFAVSIFIHEMGHFIDIKRRGLPAEMPMFLPGLGAFVKWNSLGVTRRQIAEVSLAGPLAGLVAAVACELLYVYTGAPIWAALARTGAVLNLLNLIPVWVLDGGQAATALGFIERMGLIVVALGLWVYTGSGMFFLVTAGFVWRLFTKDKPAESSWSTWVYFALLLASLGYLLHRLPAAVGGPLS